MLWMQPLKRYFEFSGRSSRAEYWQFIGVVVVAIAIGFMLDAGSESAARSGIPTLAFIVLIACMIPIYAVTFRRLHDRGMAGWIVGLQWAFNVGAYFFGAIKDSINSSIVAAPFVLIYWVMTLIQIGVGIYLLVQVAQPGDAEANQYGPPPAA